MVLVTGGSGLVGTALINVLLQNGEQVRAIYNKTALSNNNSNGKLHQVACNILDVVTLAEVMAGITEVYHCAGLVSFRKEDVQDLYKINVEGTANVVNAALTAGVKRMVHVSSVAALGRIREDEPINEKMSWTPETSNSRYGESKYLGEMEVWRGVAEGLEAVVVNPVIILGPGNWHDGSTAIFSSVYNEFPWYTNGTTGFVDVRDLANAMYMLMKTGINAEKFIVSAQNASYREVLNIMADAFGKKRPHKEVTPFLAKLVVILQSIKSKLTGKKALVTKETALTSLAEVNFDNNKLLAHLPSFQYRPLQQTIVDTCKILQHQVNRD